MSDLLGPLLGMSPYVGIGTQANAAVQASAHSRLEQARAIVGMPCFWFETPSPPLDLGIHWTRTGGKSWRVVIVR